MTTKGSGRRTSFRRTSPTRCARSSKPRSRRFAALPHSGSGAKRSPPRSSIYAATVYDAEGPLVAIEWVDPGNVVRRVYPREGENLKAVDFDNNKYPNR